MSAPLLTPADLSVAPDLVGCRPLCPRGHRPRRGYVGMHGDGVVERHVLWPVDDDAGGWTLVSALVKSRRYRCPVCGTHTTVRHRGLRAGAQYAISVITLFRRIIAPKPLGEGGTASDAFAWVSPHVALPTSNPRDGSRRWSTLTRWRRSLAYFWPRLGLPQDSDGLSAWLAALCPGGTWQEVIEAAIDAHAREGTAM